MVKYIGSLTFEEVIAQRRLPEFIKLSKRKLRDKLLHKYRGKNMKYFIDNGKLKDFIYLMKLRLTEINKHKRLTTISYRGTVIRNRKHPHDVFITPRRLAKIHIDMVYKISNFNDKLTWYDPFKASGNYFNQFPLHVRKYWSEITEGKDFFRTKGKIDIICSNPPYSIINDVLKHSIKLHPKIISYLVGVHNHTNKRLKYMNDNGYGLTHIYRTDVHSWFGTSSVLFFQKNKPNMKGLLYDLNIWKVDKD